MLPAMLGMYGGGAVLKGITAFEKVNEFKKQLRAQNAITQLYSQALIAQRDQHYYDIKRRAEFVSGAVLARAGKAGVATDSGSITEAMADVAAQTAVDKYRANLNAQFQIAENDIKIAESNRQGESATKFALLDTASGAFNFGGGVLGAFA